MSDEVKPDDRRVGQCSTCGYETSVVASKVSNWQTFHVADHGRGVWGATHVFKLADTPDTRIVWTCDVCIRSGASFASSTDPGHASAPFLRAMGWLANYIRDQATRGENP